MGDAAIRRVAGGTYDRDREVDRLPGMFAETVDRHASKSRRPGVVAMPAGSGR
jgi:hypothetical protein